MSIVSNALSIGQGIAGLDSAFKRFGLSMRFAVTFNPTTGKGTPLGDWASCKGLKVEFKTETVKRGGLYNGEVKLPTEVTYGQVVLERAMEQGPSRQLQSWLGGLVANWMNYAETGNSRPPAGELTIVLQDVYLDPVASWTLHGAYPVSWSGPVLDAKQNAVAIETLTIEHQGFLPVPPPLP
jgi:phage tail-like protein